MGNGKSVPLDTDPRCETLAPIWGPFVDAFVDTLHAKGGAVHPPPPRELRRGGSRGRRASDGDADDAAKRLAEAHALRSPGSPGSVFRPAAERLVAIGDLHGDLNKATRAFRAGGLIDSHGKWIGGATVAVQVGDQLDRGGDEVAILYMLERLRKEARDAGGELIVMNGNHETLNVAGRFRYAFEPGIEDFRRWRGRQLLGAALKAKCGEKPGGCAIVGAAAAAAAIDRKAEKNGEPRIESRGRSGNAPPPGSASGRMYADTGPGCTMPRLAALAPGGPMAKRFLAHQPVVVAVGSTLFAHGGVLPHHVQYGLERINQETSEWIRGDAKPGPPPVHVSGGRSVVWARDYSWPQRHKCDCGVLRRALDGLPGIDRVVVGHTIQQPEGVNAACDGRVLRVDVGMSEGCGGSEPEVLEILRDGAEIARLRWDCKGGRAVREPVTGSLGATATTVVASVAEAGVKPPEEPVIESKLDEARVFSWNRDHKSGWRRRLSTI